MIEPNEKKDDVLADASAYRWLPVEAVVHDEEQRVLCDEFLEMLTSAAERNAFVILKLRAPCGGGTATGKISFINSKKVVIAGGEIFMSDVESGWTVE